MRIIARKTLKEYYTKHANAKGPLESWYHEAKKAVWKTPQDIKALYRSADFLPGNRVVFNIKKNRYRLIVHIHYNNGIIFIRFVGTHAEYDKVHAETI